MYVLFRSYGVFILIWQIKHTYFYGVRNLKEKNQYFPNTKILKPYRDGCSHSYICVCMYIYTCIYKCNLRNRRSYLNNYTGE